MVNVPGYQDSPVNTPDPFAILQGSSIKSISFSQKDQFGQNQSLPLGTEFHGRLIENLISQQTRDFDTNELQFWPDGKPKFQVIATVQTDYFIDGDDDGKRRFFFSSGMLQALQAELKEKKVPRFGVGTDISVRLVNLVPTKGYPKKVYDVTLTNIQPYVSDEQAQAEQALATGQAAPQGQPVQGAQTQWAQPEASAAPGQGSPWGASQGQPVQQAQPQQQVAQPVQQPAAPAQQPAAVQQEQAPEAAQAAPAADILAEAITQVQFLVEQGVPLDTAVSAAAQKRGLGDDQAFQEALLKGATF